MKRNLMAVIYVLLIAISCSMQRKLKQIENISEKSLLSLSDEVKVAELKPVETRSDTLKVSDETGREILIMKAIKNEAGEMVATDVINAAKTKTDRKH